MRRVKIVDLTHPFDERTLYWPNAPSTFALTRLHHGKTEAGFFYSANSFCAPEHGGTHMDAPIHFAEGGSSLDRVPVDRLIAPGIVIDVRPQASADADYRLTADDVRAWEKARGTIPAGAIVLLRTGWSQRWPDRKRYFGDDTPGDASKLHFPSYGKEAAQLLVVERKVAALGVDTASIDYGPSKDFVVHQIASGANVPALENVARLEDVPETGAWIVALPMKIAGGSGGPLRIVALVPSP
jgi:kynurenine formamidase